MSMTSGSGGIGPKALIQAVINIPAALNGILTQLKAIFPASTSAITHTATGGADTLPGNPAGFLTVTINGVPVKVPFYNL
jgi:hypothetical protein